jgi:hypothetical protein
MSEDYERQVQIQAQQALPPPYRVVQKSLESLTQSLQTSTQDAEQLGLALALVTADRDEVSLRCQHSQQYIALLEAQIQVLNQIFTAYTSVCKLVHMIGISIKVKRPD